LAAAWDPVAPGAAWCGAGARVALGGSGWPQRIRVDWLWPRRHVATRAPPEPVQAAAILGARSNAYKDNGGADRPRRRRVPRRLGIWPARGEYLDSLGLLVLEGARTGAGGRRGESGVGAGAATATRRWCQRGRARSLRPVYAHARGSTASGWARSGRPRTRCPPPSPTRDEAQGLRPWRSHGGAVRVDHGGGILREGKGGQGSTWATRDRYECALGCAATRALGWRRASSSRDVNASGSARRRELDDGQRTADTTTLDS
jgi:hypothetical protein